MEELKALKAMRKELTRRHYEELGEAESKGKFVTWSPVGGPPAEILYAMDISPCFPENYVTVCCAKQEAREFCEATEARGYTIDLCSYARCGMGMMLENKGPYGPMPRPKFILGTSYACNPYTQWFETMARHWKIPFFYWEGFHVLGKTTQEQVEYLVAGLRKFISFLEEQTGRKLDWDRLKETVRLSDEAHELWRQVLDYRRAIPCPIGAREISGDIFYVIVYPGKQEAVDYYTLLRDEVKERVEKGIGIIPNEKYRLAYLNIPIWYNLQLFDYFSERGAVFVHEYYTAWVWAGWSWEQRLDPEKPLESLALKWGNFWNTWDVDKRVRKYEEIIEPFHIDGLVLFANKSCKDLVLGQRDIAKTLEEKLGIPSMEFEAEMADPRSLPEPEVKAKIDSFLEMLTQRKGVK